MRKVGIMALALVWAAPAYAQYNVQCNPNCHEVSGPTNPTPASSSTSTSKSAAQATSTSRSQATGSIAGTQVNAPITSRSQGGSASVTVINTTAASSRAGGGGGGRSANSGGGSANSGGHYSGGAGSGSAGSWRNRAVATPAADPVAADPGPALGSAGNPLVQNTNVSGTQTLRDVPEIVAPNISGGNPCLVGISGGGAGPGIGITLGIGYSDKGCERRNDAAVLSNLGEKAAAIEVLCEDDNVRAALARAGKPCEADRARMVAAPAPQARVVDPAVIRRQQEIPQQVAADPPPKPRPPDWCYTASAAELQAHPQCNPR